ncbi:glycosyltransferase family 4 protein [Acaryochloris marina]|uniref:Glycosyl transferase, group 1 family protein n=1 Tax=Acaryochloris marina (strain MBIC 11017) TaxID=329726 RepID=B0CEF0_ACAM1|nr:glycosyltransferase family 4 protein [Acaryochloris marina]ABW26916.1 glycosyl transferase, group 1 family protein [Acaryochloris marina MBIC11017]BDM81684.1 glycosyl transferase [Acaryochloris marina MBIC10699]
MKTLQIGMDWFPDKQGGGLDRYYYDLTRYLPQVGVEIAGVVTGPPTVSEQTNDQVRAFAPRQSSLLKRLWGARQTARMLLQQDDVSLLVSHFALYTFPMLDQLDHRPFIVHFHGPWSLESIVESNKSLGFQARKAMERAVFSRANRFIVLSQAFKDILQHTYDIPGERVQIIPGGVETDRFATSVSPEAARAKLQWPQDRFILFTARRLSKRMGLGNLVEAMASVCQQYPEVLLMMAGKGEQEQALKARIQELGLTNHIQMLGYLPDQALPMAYRAADLAILPTLSLEGFGLVVLESLAAGTPILGTPVGGIPEILRPFCEDLVLPGYSPQNIASGILEACSEKRHLPSAQVCEDHVRKNYDWSVIVQQVQASYQEVVNEDS